MAQAPATVAAFRADVRTAIKSRRPCAKITFVGRTRRFARAAHQPAGTVSFLTEVTIDGTAFLADGIHYGGALDARVGRGHLSVSPKGNREVWS